VRVGCSHTQIAVMAKVSVLVALAAEWVAHHIDWFVQDERTVCPHLTYSHCEKPRTYKQIFKRQLG
jgi:hypothetical protein